VKYTIENKGTGVVMFRVFVPESMARSFLDFITSSQNKLTNDEPALIRQLSHYKNENYFIKKTQAALEAFRTLQAPDMSKTSVISEVTKKLKVLGFADISFDQISTILTQNGCFRSNKVK
jgi:hypothetical protein